MSLNADEVFEILYNCDHSYSYTNMIAFEMRETARFSADQLYANDAAVHDFQRMLNTYSEIAAALAIISSNHQLRRGVAAIYRKYEDYN